jgi:hypothetical protein
MPAGGCHSRYRSELQWLRGCTFPGLYSRMLGVYSIAFSRWLCSQQDFRLRRRDGPQLFAFASQLVRVWGELNVANGFDNR